MKKFLIIAVLLVVLGGAAWLYTSRQQTSMMEEKQESTKVEQSESMPTKAQEATPETESATTASRTTKTFNVDGKNFSFTVKEMKVKQGDTVRIVFTSVGGFHDWVLDEFHARTKQIPSGQSDTIEFVASKKGTFEYYCSVGSHRMMGMKGTLIVE